MFQSLWDIPSFIFKIFIRHCCKQKVDLYIIFIGYSTVFCKIRGFICTSLRSTEIVLDER